MNCISSFNRFFLYISGEDNKSQHSHEEDKNLMTSSMTLPSRPSRQTSNDSGLDASDKSLSQPNVAIRETDILGVDAEPSPPPTPEGRALSSGRDESIEPGLRKDSAKSTPPGSRVASTGSVSSSDLSPISEHAEKKESEKKVIVKPSPSSSPSTTMMKSAILTTSLMSTSLISASSKAVEKSTDAVKVRSMERRGSAGGGESTSIVSNITTSEHVSEDFCVDIDTALEEVMAGLRSLEMQQKHDKRMSLPAVKTKQTPKHTPDLVLDLPDGDITSSSTDSIEPTSPTISAAENFAKSNQGTLKKASCPSSVHQETAKRLSISSDSGELACTRVLQQDEKTVVSSQPSFSTFSNKRTQYAVTKSPVVESQGQPEASSNSSPQAPASSPTSSVQPAIPPSPSAPPPVAQKPKPPMKMKPPVMKKPTSRPDVSQPPP